MGLQALTTIASSTSAATGGFLFVVYLVLIVAVIAAYWSLFEKAGEAGWKAIIPIYNMYVLCQIAGRNGLWFLGMLIPFVNIIIWLIISIDLAKHFGKSTAFGVVGLWLFSIIGLLILGYGDAKYVGPKHA